MPTNHYALTEAHRMRVCHYCSQPIQMAFYLQALRTTQHAWACPDCYIEHYVPQHAGQRTARTAPTEPDLLNKELVCA